MYVVYCENIVYDDGYDVSTRRDPNYKYHPETNHIERYILYAPSIAAQGFVITDAKWSPELTTAGTFEFSVPPTNPYYDKLQLMGTTIIIERDGEEVWRGRVTSIQIDYYKIKEIECEGELAFLNDVPFEGYDFSQENVNLEYCFRRPMMVYSAFSLHTNRHITFGEVIGFDEDELDKSAMPKITNEKCVSIYELFDTYLLDADDDGIPIGYFKFRTDPDDGDRKIDYYKWGEGFEECSQKIIFGQNLLDFTQEVDGSELYTYIIPMGPYNSETESREYYLTYVSSSEGSRSNVQGADGNYYYEDHGFGDITASRLFGKIKKTLFLEEEDITLKRSIRGIRSPTAPVPEGGYKWFTTIGTWDMEMGQEQIENMAKKILAKAVAAAETFTVSAIDLHNMNVSIEEFNIGKLVRVSSPPHGIENKLFLCTKMDVDLFDPGNVTFTFEPYVTEEDIQPHSITISYSGPLFEYSNPTDYTGQLDRLIVNVEPIGGATNNLVDSSMFTATVGGSSNVYINATTGAAASATSSPAYRATGYLDCSALQGKQIALNHGARGNTPGIAFYTSQSTSGYISGVKNNNATPGTPKIYTVPDNAAYMRLTTLEEYVDEIQLVEIKPFSRHEEVQVMVSSAHSPGTGVTYTVNIGTAGGKAIYKGTVNFTTGQHRRTWDRIASYNGETIPGKWLSDRDIYVEGSVPTIGAEVLYELETPSSTTYDDRITNVYMILGQNYIWADTGDISLTVTV